jgi:hypothetical protein
LDTWASDDDADFWDESEDDADEQIDPSSQIMQVLQESDYKNRAREIYERYATQFRKRFKWLRPTLFEDALGKDLQSDAKSLMKILKTAGAWDANRDAKLQSLLELLTKQHLHDKVLIFTQFADTVDYLTNQLRSRGVTAVEGVSGATEDPTSVAYRFSPVSNNKRDTISSVSELRIILATDVLSEGQNLQDCSVIVNFDLPWAIIRLIQRAGRVDRIGQKSDRILCYSFLPADGVERIINLRGRVKQRLKENAEVVGTDEEFFDDDEKSSSPLLNLYHEKSGILDGDDDTEVDLASYAYQIWKNAIDRDPELEKIIVSMPNVVYSTRPHEHSSEHPEGALVYLKTSEGHDALAWIDKNGKSVTESQFAILKTAECGPETPAIPRHDGHHEMVSKGVKLIVETEKSVGGQLGRPSGARFRTYERLKHYADEVKNTLFATPDLNKAIEDVYKYPLLQSATDTLNRQLKSGIDDPALAELVIALRQDARLCRVAEDEESTEPHVICSMGLRTPTV